MRNTVFVIVTFFLLSKTINAQKFYELDLKPDAWSFNPDRFYFSEIADDRIDKSNVGQVLGDNGTITAKFKISLGDDLKNIIAASMQADSSKVPLLLSFEKFSLNETGNVSHHKATFEYYLKIYRIIDGKRYPLYEVKGKPEMEMRGNYPMIHERNIREGLKRSIEGFNQWIRENPDQQLLTRKVVVIFEPESGYLNQETSDTLLWKKDYKLQWSDFKGKPNASTFMAQSGCLFTYRAVPVVKNDIVELHLSLFAGFDRNLSWVIKGQEKDSLLAHEQLHFDICELNIRSLRAKISEIKLDIMNYGPQIETLFNQAWNDYQSEQDRYDEETRHGIVPDKQQAWKRDVWERLKP